MEISKLYTKILILTFFFSADLMSSEYTATFDTEKFAELDEILKKYPMQVQETNDRPDPLGIVHKCYTNNFVVCLPEQGGFHVFGQTEVITGFWQNHLYERVPSYRTEFLDMHIPSLEQMQLESYGIKNCKNVLIFNQRTKGFLFFHAEPCVMKHRIFPILSTPVNEQKFVGHNNLEDALPDLGEVKDLSCIIVSFTAQLISDFVSSIEHYGIKNIQVSCGKILYEGKTIGLSVNPVTGDTYGGRVREPTNVHNLRFAPPSKSFWTAFFRIF